MIGCKKEGPYLLSTHLRDSWFQINKNKPEKDLTQILHNIHIHPPIESSFSLISTLDPKTVHNGQLNLTLRNKSPPSTQNCYHT